MNTEAMMLLQTLGPRTGIRGTERLPMLINLHQTDLRLVENQLHPNHRYIFPSRSNSDLRVCINYKHSQPLCSAALLLWRPGELEFRLLELRMFFFTLALNTFTSCSPLNLLTAPRVDAALQAEELL